MQPNSESFALVVAGLLEGYCVQNDLSVPALASRLLVGTRMWNLLEERGWPRALAPNEAGVSGDMPAGDVTGLSARLLAGVDGDQKQAWHLPVRQLIKACFYPLLRTCRDSYRERGSDGVCRRQILDRVKGRISGTHCVDCPHWTALTPQQHMKLLEQHWQPDRWEEFIRHRHIYLPEGFRILRHMLHGKMRGIRT